MLDFCNRIIIVLTDKKFSVNHNPTLYAPGIVHGGLAQAGLQLQSGEGSGDSTASGMASIQKR